MPAKKRATRRKRGARSRAKKQTFTAEEISNALGHIVDWINVLRRLLKSMPKDCVSVTSANLDQNIIEVTYIGGREKVGCPPAR